MELLSDSQPMITQEALLHRIANRIRYSLELKEILNATVAEVRSYLATDRVMIYQFSADGSGVVIAESVEENRLPSLLGLHFPADDIPLYARELFVRARQRSIVDISNSSIGISPLNFSDTDKPADEQNIRYRPVDPCHIEYLTAMAVKSSVVVPIVLEAQATLKNQPPSLRSQAQLWGIVASHHSEPRNVTEQELQFIQAVVDQVVVAITHSILLNQVRAQAKQEANINRITLLLYTPDKVIWEAAIEEAVKTFNGSGGRLYLLADGNQPVELHTFGSQPQQLNKELNRVIEENLLWQNFLNSVIQPKPDQTGYKPWSVEWMRAVYDLVEITKDVDSRLNLWAIKDLYEEPLFRTLAPFFQSTKIRSLLIIPLNYGSHLLGCLTIFREEVDIEILWAGWHNPDTRQLMPRQSFEVWRQQKKGQTNPWTDEELKYAQALGERFSSAVKQYRSSQQIQALNTNLEKQVRERTEQQQILQVLFNVVAKIRESLNIDTIFKTTASEVRSLLNADRVGVFCFEPNSGFNQGKFVAEDVLPKFPSALAEKVINQCFPEEFAVDYHKGSIQVIPDINNSTLNDDQIAMLSQLQIKAQIIVPLMKGNELWGLLCIHQCGQTRNWQNFEIQFIQQIATQLSVALEQAELLNQTKNQAEQLAITLHELQATQTQLIQNEKMSSLGQLVAGVAHEINNPVNFIHGNLIYIEEYINHLIKLFSIYQEQGFQNSAEMTELAAEIDLDFIAEDLPKSLSSMKIGTERIRQIVLSLRNFSRLDQAELKPVNIHEGLDSTLLILQHRLKAKANSTGIEIVKEYGKLPLVECYAGLLNQVFMNILSNAIDALEQRHIELSTSGSPTQVLENPSTILIRTQVIDNSRVAIYIKDNGLGIPEEVQKNIFDPFFTTKPVGKGTGLGLSISYQIITITHKGELKFLSTIGEGTEFIIEIPIEQNLN